MLSGSGPFASMLGEIDPALGMFGNMLAQGAMMGMGAGMAGGLPMPGGVEGMADIGVMGDAMPQMDMPSMPQIDVPTPEPSMLDNMSNLAVQGMDRYDSLLSNPIQPAQAAPALSMPQMTTGSTPPIQPPQMGAPQQPSSPSLGGFADKLSAGQNTGAGGTAGKTVAQSGGLGDTGDKSGVDNLISEIMKNQMKMLKMKMGIGAGTSVLKGVAGAMKGDEFHGRQASYKKTGKRRNDQFALQARSRRQLLQGTLRDKQKAAMEGGAFPRQAGAGTLYTGRKV